MPGRWPRLSWVLPAPIQVVRPEALPLSPAQLMTIVVVCSLVYGGVMGTFGGLEGDRPWQMLYSAVKLPLLLGITFLLGLPAFFVLNTLLGVREDFGAALRSLLRSQAGLAVVLVALAPYTMLWYASSADYPAATLFNGLMLALASGAAQVLLWRAYRPLIARRPVHRWLLRTWLTLYVFVAIQMAWVLRPFLGQPGVPVQFFREDSWGNAYLVVLRIMWEMRPH